MHRWTDKGGENEGTEAWGVRGESRTDSEGCILMERMRQHSSFYPRALLQSHLSLTVRLQKALLVFFNAI